MSKKMLYTLILISLAGLLSASTALAQEPLPNTPLTGLGSGFSYQGQLVKDGVSYTGVCDFRFSLWDAPTGGVQVGLESNAAGVTVSNGLFMTLVNASGEFGANAFNGDARWLKVEVQCSGDSNFTALDPPQLLSAVPYALSLRPGAIITGAVPTTLSAYTNDLSEWATGIYGQSLSNNYGVGVYGYANATDGYTYGVVGTSDSPNGRGIVGQATATTGPTYGVSGISDSTEGIGVRGWVSSLSGTTYGVFGRSDSTAGRGVRGWVSALSGTTYGVYGVSDSTGGRGVGGFATALSGSTYGVYGGSDSSQGVGVRGNVYSSTGTTYGVYGTVDSSEGTGVRGYATSTTGVTYGVQGLSDSTEGRGVRGWVSSTSGTTYGVVGLSFSTDGTGVYGHVDTDTGVTYGVLGRVQSIDGYAGFFDNPAGTGLFVTNNSPYTNTYMGNDGNGPVLTLRNGGTGDSGDGGGYFIQAVNSTQDDNQFSVTSDGTVYADGTFTSPAADLAEMMVAAPGLEAGEVLVIGPDGILQRSTEVCQTSLAGVYSTQPAFLGGAAESGTNPGEVPLTITGVAPVKVSAENGPIQPGDVLTTSLTPGHAMKADPLSLDGASFYPPGCLLGKALEELDQGTGLILVLLVLN